ncbi:MAG TPA: hypothetical protein DD990_36910 [Cyanobacteria bacterium UBA11368]|nr:hypothetical protein [Cyanobacteria bacterium UBA11368]
MGTLVVLIMAEKPDIILPTTRLETGERSLSQGFFFPSPVSWPQSGANKMGQTTQILIISLGIKDPCGQNSDKAFGSGGGY